MRRLINRGAETIGECQKRGQLGSKVPQQCPLSATEKRRGSGEAGWEGTVSIWRRARECIAPINLVACEAWPQGLGRVEFIAWRQREGGMRQAITPERGQRGGANQSAVASFSGPEKRHKQLQVWQGVSDSGATTSVTRSSRPVGRQEG